MQDQILWTALVTPFTTDNQIDYPALEKLLKRQEEVGNGVILFGSTGESLSISNEERQGILKHVLSMNLHIPIMVGVPSYNMVEALNWVNFCANFKVSSYLLTTPIYTKPGVKGQTEWFKKIMDEINAPAMLYNIPGRAAIRLHPEVLKNLQDHKNFWAIKDSSGTVDSVFEYNEAAPKIKIFCGDDYMMPAMAIEGAVGLISVVSNVWPNATRLYVKKCLANQQLPTKVWWRACKALFTASNPIPTKAFLAHLGLIEPVIRLPLSLDDLPSLEPIQKIHQEILDWERDGKLVY